MRVSVFVDGANFFFMQRDGLKWFADPKKMLECIENRYGEIADAFYYIGKDAPPDARQQAFLSALPEMGFSVVTKQIKTIYDSKTGTIRKKANLDIEIVLDMFNTIESYDLAVLVSGDGDFDRALQLLKARGKRTVVISTENFIATELRATAGRHYIDLASMEAQIRK
ncbi:MAG: NYN domain-containing protein [Paludibacteraceae bacterium]|nr:NYN domain-containing protein [Paludibacteraceae bacterium]